MRLLAFPASPPRLGWLSPSPSFFVTGNQVAACSLRPSSRNRSPTRPSSKERHWLVQMAALALGSLVKPHLLTAPSSVPSSAALEPEPGACGPLEDVPPMLCGNWGPDCQRRPVGQQQQQQHRSPPRHFHHHPQPESQFHSHTHTHLHSHTQPPPQTLTYPPPPHLHHHHYHQPHHESPGYNTPLAHELAPDPLQRIPRLLPPPGSLVTSASTSTTSHPHQPPPSSSSSSTLSKTTNPFGIRLRMDDLSRASPPPRSPPPPFLPLHLQFTSAAQGARVPPGDYARVLSSQQRSREGWVSPAATGGCEPPRSVAPSHPSPRGPPLFRSQAQTPSHDQQSRLPTPDLYRDAAPSWPRPQGPPPALAAQASGQVLGQAVDGSPRPGMPNLVGADRAQALSDMHFRLLLRQQPRAAHACEFRDRDRRVIDPPPIVQLVIESAKMTEDELQSYLCYESYVMNYSICDQSGTRDASFMPEEYQHQRRLMGSLVGTPFVGQDDKGAEGCFFCFGDLSCRTPGAFRLKFTLIMIDPTRAGTIRHFPILTETLSDVFNVYSAKEFPGMLPSSNLAKRLKEQGCIISIKKSNERLKNPRGHNDLSDADEDLGEASQRRRHMGRH